MRIGLLAGWLVIIAVLWPLVAAAGTPEFEKDYKAAKKYAIGWWDDTWDAKGRGLCVCLSNPGYPEFEGKLGIVRITREVEFIAPDDRDMIGVECTTFAYDQTTGERSNFARCMNWTPLSK
jgi:hypothetical protein